MEYIYNTILNNEINQIRFKNYCMDICSKERGITLVPTSRSWDLGRDAREILLGKKKLPVYLCATLNKEIDSKVEHDMSRLKETTKVDSLIYCCSKELTEYYIEDLKKKIQSMFNIPIDVEVLGQVQLSKLAEKYPDIFKKYYAQELKDLLKMITTAESGTETAEQRGLRLALSTFASEDAVSLRKFLSRRIILEFLSIKDNQSIHELSKEISDGFHLPRSIDKGYLESILKILMVDGLALEDNERWSATSEGKKEAKTISPEALQNLLEGKNIISNAIKQLTGYNLGEEQFNTVWNIIQDSIAEIFYSNGLSVVQMMNSFLYEGETLDESQEFYKLVGKMADRIATQFIIPDQAMDIRQAIIDMFCERTSEPFQWLASICLVFITICALGFEGTSASELYKVFQRIKIVLDTDILITLLCEGEPDHKETEELLNRWKAIGGEIYVSCPVLEELAYHAWISEIDYNGTCKLFNTLKTETEIQRYIINAFVRTFRMIAKGRYDFKNWYFYINQYKGDDEKDYSKILEICLEDFGFNILTEAGEEYSQFIEETKEFIVDLRKKPDYTVEELKRIKDKSERDARLLASILRYRETERKKGSGKTMSLVTSSSLFRQAEIGFSHLLRKPETVLLMSAFSYLVSLLPGVQFTVGSLKAVLFDYRATTRLMPDERLAMRVIKDSAKYDFPFARRTSLRRELDLQVRRQAVLEETSYKKEKEKLRKESKSEAEINVAAGMISKALVALSIETLDEIEISKVMQESEKLKKENEALRDQLKILSKKTKHN